MKDFVNGFRQKSSVNNVHISYFRKRYLRYMKISYYSKDKTLEQYLKSIYRFYYYENSILVL